jgi:heme-degrading monooxygenase HmoA
MAEVATIRRWTLNEGFDEAELLALVRDRLIPAYDGVPGCTRQHLFRSGGPRSYVALTFWDSKESLDTWSGAGGQPWRDQHREVLARWLELMSFREEFDADVLVSN